MDINAKYQAIKKIATSTGANRDMVYHWKLRGKMPRDWQIKVWKASSGAIEFSDMEAVFEHFREKAGAA